LNSRARTWRVADYSTPQRHLRDGRTNAASIDGSVRPECELVFPWRAQKESGSFARASVEALREQGRSANSIAAELGISKSTVCYHLRRLGVPADARCNRRYDWQAVQRFYDEGTASRNASSTSG
jgi:regulatory ArsR family protein